MLLQAWEEELLERELGGTDVHKQVVAELAMMKEEFAHLSEALSGDTEARVTWQGVVWANGMCR